MQQKAVIYARVSSREQEETGYSLDAQEKLLSEYARQKGLEVAKVFRVSESASGKQIRIVFEEMLRYTSTHRVSVVLCEKIDRLTRNLKDAATVSDWIQQNPERELHFVKENFIVNRNTRAHENLVWDMKVAIARFYTNNLSEEVKKGQKEKIAQGWLPTKPPLGYKTEGDKGHKIHVPDCEKARLIRQMFELYATGSYSIQHLSQVMYELGLRTRGGSKLVRSRLASLLADPFYVGGVVWKGSLSEGKQEPLVSRDLFDRVQSVLKSKTNSSKHRKHTYLFKGLIGCRDCGGMLTWESQKGILYGHCSQYRNCSKRKWYKEKDFEEAITQELDGLRIASPRLAEWVRKALKELHKTEIADRDASLSALHTQQERLRQREKMLYDDRLDGRVSAETYDVKHSELQKGIQDVLEGLQRHSESDKRYYELGTDIFELSQHAADIFKGASTEKKIRLLRLMCEEIYVSENRLVVKFSEAFNALRHLLTTLPEGSKTLQNLPSPLQIFELEKGGSAQAYKGASDPKMNPQLRG